MDIDDRPSTEVIQWEGDDDGGDDGMADATFTSVVHRSVCMEDRCRRYM